MEKKKYVTPKVEAVQMETSHMMMAVSGEGMGDGGKISDFQDKVFNADANRNNAWDMW